MRIAVVHGNPRAGGFVHGSLDLLAARLEDHGAAVDRLHLRELDIGDCLGCFRCFKTGRCVLADGMSGVYDVLRHADGLVIGCPVRNESVPALYKRFLERITFPLGFGTDLEGTYVLSLVSVGLGGGRRETARLLGLGGFGAYHVEHLYFRLGIPSRVTPAAVEPRLVDALDRLEARIRSGWKPARPLRIARTLPRVLLRRYISLRNPELFDRHERRCDEPPGS
jgi:multimeric flavodoxin WrbA